jgi:hypothetical protein
MFIYWLPAPETITEKTSADIKTAGDVIGANTFTLLPGLPKAIYIPSVVNRYEDSSSAWIFNTVEIPEMDATTAGLPEGQPIGYHDLGWGVFPLVYKHGDGWSLSQDSSAPLVRFVSAHGNLETREIMTSPGTITFSNGYLTIPRFQALEFQEVRFR